MTREKPEPPGPLHEVAPGVLQWSVWHPEKSLNFNGTFLRDPAGNVAIDPPHLDPAHLERIWTEGGVAHVIITSRDHVRNTAELVQRTSAKVHAPRKDAESAHVSVDETYGDGDELPGGLLAIAIPDSKTPGESALLLRRDGGTLILGDALIGRPAGRLSLLPDEKFADAAKAVRGLRVLLRHDFTRVLVGDGENPADGRHAVEDFLVHHGIAPRRR